MLKMGMGNPKLGPPTRNHIYSHFDLIDGDWPSPELKIQEVQLNTKNLLSTAKLIESTYRPLNTNLSESLNYNWIIDYAIEDAMQLPNNRINYKVSRNINTAIKHLGLTHHWALALFWPQWSIFWFEPDTYLNGALSLQDIPNDQGKIWDTLLVGKGLMPQILRRLASWGWDRFDFYSDELGGWLLINNQLQEKENGNLIWKWHKDIAHDFGESTIAYEMLKDRERSLRGASLPINSHYYDEKGKKI